MGDFGAFENECQKKVVILHRFSDRVLTDFGFVGKSKSEKCNFGSPL
jgi:hypothetical protein